MSTTRYYFFESGAAKPFGYRVYSYFMGAASGPGFTAI